MKYIIKDYEPLTIPKSINLKETKKSFTLEINGATVKVIPEYIDGLQPDKIKSVQISKEEYESIKEEFNAQEDPYPFIIKNFKYNGFIGQNLDGIAPYKAVFIKWSGDPGIAQMMCSDRQTRLIPTFALKGHGYSLPYDNTKNKVIFGTASKS